MTTTLSPSESYSITMRLEIQNKVGMLGKVTTAIGEVGGDIGAVDLSGHGKGTVTRDVTARANGIEHAQKIITAVKALPGVKIINVSDRTFLMHLGGKIALHPKVAIKTRNDLSMAYTPGLTASHGDQKDVRKSFPSQPRNPSRRLGRDGGPGLGTSARAAMPVMEGKACCSRSSAGSTAGRSASTRRTPMRSSDRQGARADIRGVNLEDISAPRCFEIEDRLKAEMGIPSSTTTARDGGGRAGFAAELLKIVKKRIEDMKIVVAVWALGVECSKIFLNAGARNIIGVDRIGAIYKGRKQHMNFMKDWYAAHTNPFNEKGKLSDVMAGADLFLGLAGPGLITVEDLKKMAKDPLVFAMANPEPEIHPEERCRTWDHGDGPLRLPEQSTTPWSSRGSPRRADSRASCINEEMKLAAAYAIASCVGKEELSEDYIIPSMFNRKVALSVAKEVARAAHRTKVARRTSKAYMEIHLD